MSMPVPQKELKKAIRIGVKTLVIQEVRLLRLEHALTPAFIVDEMIRSIGETKREIAKLAKAMAEKERVPVLRRMIRQAVDEEIDQAVEFRKTRCVRCLHGRFYDEAGAAHEGLPVKSRAKTVGCDKLRPSLRRSCRRFVQMSTAASLDHYLNEMTLLYEFRDAIDQIEEIWKDYLVK